MYITLNSIMIIILDNYSIWHLSPYRQSTHHFSNIKHNIFNHIFTHPPKINNNITHPHVQHLQNTTHTWPDPYTTRWAPSKAIRRQHFMSLSTTYAAATPLGASAPGSPSADAAVDRPRWRRWPRWLQIKHQQESKNTNIYYSNIIQ